MIVLTYKEKKGDKEGMSEGGGKTEKKKSSIPHLYFASQNSFSISTTDTEAEPDECLQNHGKMDSRYNKISYVLSRTLRHTSKSNNSV